MLAQCVVPLWLTVYAPESLLPDGFGAEVYPSPFPPCHQHLVCVWRRLPSPPFP